LDGTEASGRRADSFRTAVGRRQAAGFKNIGRQGKEIVRLFFFAPVALSLFFFFCFFFGNL